MLVAAIRHLKFLSNWKNSDESILNGNYDVNGMLKLESNEWKEKKRKKHSSEKHFRLHAESQQNNIKFIFVRKPLKIFS